MVPASSEPRQGRPLLWLVFMANFVVFLVALLLLAFSPITIDAPSTTNPASNRAN